MIKLKNILIEFTDASKEKIRQQWQKERSELTPAQMNFYIDTFEKYKNKSIFTKKDIMQYKFEDLEKLIDANFSKEKTLPKYEGDFDLKNLGTYEHDLLYEGNGLVIVLSDLRQKCIYYGKGHKWCIARTDTSNMFSSYRYAMNERIFYFVFDRDLPSTNHNHALVVLVDKHGKYYVADADNGSNSGSSAVSWDYICRLQPKLKDLKDLFKAIPLSTDERSQYDRIKHVDSDESYADLSYDDKEFYISLGEELNLNRYIATPDELKNKYIVMGHEILEDMFNKSSNRLKNTYLNTVAKYGKPFSWEKSYMSPKQLEYHTFSRQKYISDMISSGEPLSVEDYAESNDENKKHFIDVFGSFNESDDGEDYEDDDNQTVISYADLHDMYVNHSDNNIKKYWIKYLNSHKEMLSMGMFLNMDEDLRKFYVTTAKFPAHKLMNYRLAVMNVNQQKKYIDIIEKSHINDEDDPRVNVNVLKPEAKFHYAMTLGKNNNYIPYSIFRLLTHDLKIQYIKNIKHHQMLLFDELDSDDLRAMYIDRFGESLNYNSVRNCSDYIKKLFLSKIIDANKKIDGSLFSEMTNAQLISYIKKGHRIDDYFLLPKKLQQLYLVKEIQRDIHIHVSEYSSMVEPVKKYYINKLLNRADKQFKLGGKSLLYSRLSTDYITLTPEKLREYIVNECLKRGQVVPERLFSYIPNDKKFEYMESLSKSTDRLINRYMYNELSDAEKTIISNNILLRIMNSDLSNYWSLNPDSLIFNNASTNIKDAYVEKILSVTGKNNFKSQVGEFVADYAISHGFIDKTQ